MAHVGYLRVTREHVRSLPIVKSRVPLQQRMMKHFLQEGKLLSWYFRVFQDDETEPIRSLFNDDILCSDRVHTHTWSLRCLRITGIDIKKQLRYSTNATIYCYGLFVVTLEVGLWLLSPFYL